MASEIMIWYKLCVTCTAETHSWCCHGNVNDAVACLVQHTQWQNYAEQYSWAASTDDIALHLEGGKYVQNRTRGTLNDLCFCILNDVMTQSVQAVTINIVKAMYQEQTSWYTYWWYHPATQECSSPCALGGVQTLCI